MAPRLWLIAQAVPEAASVAIFVAVAEVVAEDGAGREMTAAKEAVTVILTTETAIAMTEVASGKGIGAITEIFGRGDLLSLAPDHHPEISETEIATSLPR